MATKLLLSQNTQTPSYQKSKTYWKKMALAVAAAVILTVIVTSSIVNVTQAKSQTANSMFTSGSHTVELLSGPIVLNSNGCYLTGFEVPNGAKNSVLQGNYTVKNNATSHKAAIVTVWSQQEFLNYFGNKNAEPCYNKNLMPLPQDSLSIPVSEGYYLIMVSSAGAQNAVMETELTLTFIV